MKKGRRRRKEREKGKVSFTRRESCCSRPWTYLLLLLSLLDLAFLLLPVRKSAFEGRFLGHSEIGGTGWDGKGGEGERESWEGRRR